MQERNEKNLKILVEIFNFSIDKCHDFFYDKKVSCKICVKEM